MHWELTKIQARPGASWQVLTAVADLLNKNQDKKSRLWTTEIGDINEVVVLRRIEQGARTPLAEDRRLLTETSRLTKAAHSLICETFPDTSVEDTAAGPICEMRTYEFRASSTEELVKAWAAPLKRRCTLSPALAVMMTIEGDPRRLIHFWTYRSLEERMALRREAAAPGYWPPPGGRERWIDQTTAILIPANI